MEMVGVDGEESSNLLLECECQQQQSLLLLSSLACVARPMRSSPYTQARTHMRAAAHRVCRRRRPQEPDSDGERPQPWQPAPAAKAS